jgi:hypothetical protein
MASQLTQEEAVSTEQERRQRWKPAANHPWRQYRAVADRRRRVAYWQQSALREYCQAVASTN